MSGRRLRALAALAVSALAIGLAPATADADTPGGSISGTITVPAGADVTRVRVYASSTSGAGQAAPAVVQPDGRYLLANVPAGIYHVLFIARDQGLAYEEWPDATHLDEARTVTVGAGPVTGIDAHMLMGGTVSGRILTSSDCDLTKVSVLAQASGMLLPTPTVLADGTWSVRGLAPASDYFVNFDGRTAGLDGYATWPSPGTPRVEDRYFTVLPGSTRTGVDVTLTGPAHGCVAPRDYVAQLYRDLLGRQGDWTSLNVWTNDLVWSHTTIARVAESFTSSDEFRTRLLDDTYRAYLGRGTDPSGLAFWLAEMRAGRPIEAVQAGFIASDEFYAASGGTPEGWVRGLYRTVLDREPSQPEVDWWVNAIGHGMNRGSVAGGFLYSTEHLTTVVDGYYQWLLRRHIDPVGARDWVARIQQGYRDEAIIAGIVASPEYATHVPR
jgi:hypothetical protein